jgi:hypothetical protein
VRFELFADARRVGSVWWEAPGQVRVEVGESGDRDFLTGYFTGDDVYLAGGFEDTEAFDVRRRDSTPWEFERACRALVGRYRVFPETAGPVGPRQGAGAS